MEPIKEFGNVGSIKDLIAQSFIVSGGSLAAHGFFIRGLAKHLNLEPDEVSQTFKKTILDFSKTDIKDLLKTMTDSHKQNESAKGNTIGVLRNFKDLDISEILAEQIPIHQNAFNLFLANEEKYDMATIDRAVSRAWESNSKVKTYSDLKSINAELGLYDNLEWWKMMPESEKNDITNLGKKLLV